MCTTTSASERVAAAGSVWSTSCTGHVCTAPQSHLIDTYRDLSVRIVQASAMVRSKGDGSMRRNV